MKTTYFHFEVCQKLQEKGIKGFPCNSLAVLKDIQISRKTTNFMKTYSRAFNNHSNVEEVNGT